jgi:hypothetical protein
MCTKGFPFRPLVLALLACLLVLAPARAQIENNLSAYTGANAKGYLNPLKEAFGAALNSGFFRTADIPRSGLEINLEIKAMIVKFGDSDRTFNGRTEEGFVPATGSAPAEATAPTVVGDTHAVLVPGAAGTGAVFPGGLNLKSLGLAVPQLTIGSVAGSQLVVRYVAFDTGDTEIGNLSLFGIGARHSISQYFEKLPCDIAGGLMYQKFKLGKSFIDTSALTVGVQASKKYSVVEPYLGLSLDTFDMSVKYNSDTSSPPTHLNVKFDKGTNLHLTGGLGLNLSVLHLSGEVDLASQTSFVLGLSVGN